MEKGRFIVFEGIDGAGSTTQAKLTSEYLISRGIDVFLTKEPTTNKLGKEVREVLQHKWKMRPLGFQLLFSADRDHHLDSEIEPALNSGVWVVCDRYYYSTLAYGSLAGYYDILKMVNSEFLAPDLSFYLKIPPEEAIKRIDKKGSKRELFEQIQTLEKVCEGYERAYREEDIVKIDAMLPREEIQDMIKGYLLNLL